jgi:PAS domain S-box-containing protein
MSSGNNAKRGRGTPMSAPVEGRVESKPTVASTGALSPDSPRSDGERLSRSGQQVESTAGRDGVVPGDAPRHDDDSKGMLTAIVRSSDAAIISKTLGGIVTSWNPSAERIFGYTASEMIGKPIDVIAAQDRPGEMALILDRIRRGERIENLETERRHKDGHIVNISLTVSPIYDEKGRIIGASKIAADITERKRTEAQLKIKSEALAAIVRSSDAAIISKTLGGIVTTWNPAAEKIFGYTASEMIGKPIDLIAAPDRPGEMAGILDRIRRGERVEHFETERRHKDGHVVNILLTVSPIYDEKGRIVGASKIAADITERKRTEADLKVKSDTLAAIVRSSDAAIIGKTLDGIVTSWNPAAEKIFGYTASEMIGKSIDVIAAPDRPGEMAQILERIRRGERIENFETQRRCKDGRIVDISLTVSPIHDEKTRIIGVSKIAADLTERKRTEAQLRIKSETLAAVVRSSAAAIISKTLDGIVTSWNAGAEKIFGYGETEMIGRPIDVIAAPDRPGEMAVILDRIRRGERVENLETVRRHKDGHIVNISLTVSPIYDEKSRVIGASKIAADITERKRFEEAHKRLAAMVESSGDAIIGVTLDGTITSWNRGAERLFCYPPQEVVGQPVFMLVPQSRVDQELRRLEHVARDERIENFETLYRRRDGSEFDASVTLSPVRDASGRVGGVSAIVRNITTERRMKDALIAREMQMRALAGHLNAVREEERTRLSRRVHDELGQLLTGLKMDLRWLAKQVDPAASPADSAVQARFAAAGELVGSAMKTVQNIALELRPSVLDTLGLPAALREESRRFEERTRVSAVVRADDASLPNPTISTQLFRIFQELVTNVTRHAKASTLRVDFHGRGGEWVLRVEDDGVGFHCDEGALRSSLGLLGMKERAELIGGTFRIESALGGGTVATVQVPK